LFNKCFSFAGVYVANTYSIRRHLWRDLSSFTDPWFILDDFNVVLSIDECKGGVDSFLDWINNNDLTNMSFSSPCYTWSNGRRELQRIDRKLDRAL